MSVLHILWDESHIWGLLSVRAARAMELPYRLVRGADIARGLLTRERPALLLVPGGSARRKAESLGAAGLSAIRDYVGSGGGYLGFCGGAGLALSSPGASSGLALCPWQRAPFDDRLQHFMSGHLYATLAPQPGPDISPNGLAGPLIPDNMPEAPLLPVWWPGRFAPRPDSGVEVLASYDRPGDDFWLADLAVADLPEDTFAAWRDLYGLSLTPAFLAGQPCLIHGRHGRGGYVLSYSHLETPASPHANLWLAHLLRVFGALRPARELLPPWQGRAGSPLWADPDLDRLEDLFAAVLRAGNGLGLLFHRTDWLIGWRAGIPGANLNNIWAALGLIRSLPPANEALEYWRGQREKLLAAAGLFRKGAIQYLLAERLAKTIPSAVPAAMLRDQREALFGPPMRAGGLYRAIIDPLDSLAYLQLKR